MIKATDRLLPRGFTIVEMAVVIAITAVIIALLVPTLRTVRARARTAKGLANLKQIHHGLSAYAADHNGTLPIGYHAQTPGTAPDTDWSILLNSTMTGSGATYASFPGGIPQTLPIFRDPNASYPDQGFLHYSAHPVLMPNTANISDAAVAWRQYKLARMRRPAEVILIMDATQNPAHPTIPYTAFATTKNVDSGSLHPYWGAPLKEYFNPADADNNTAINPGLNDDSINNLGNIRWRQHGNTAANFVFPDGHSTTIKIGQIKKRNIRVDP